MWRYTLLSYLLYLPVLLYTLWQTLRSGEIPFLRQRMGWELPKRSGGIWLHAASVGEVNAVAPLILALRARGPQQAITLTVNTPSGGSTARKCLPQEIQIHYLPFDFPGATRRFVRHLQADACLIMETEIWPHLYRACHEQATPITIINGRISERTLNAKKWMRRIYGIILKQVSHILTRTDTDRIRFMQLGANADSIEVIGNIKYSIEHNTDATPVQLPRPFVLAASTRDGEEKRIMQAWQQVTRHADYLLVIVPRHPQRLARILSDVSGFSPTTAIRSRNEEVSPATELYIADTFGELNGFIAGAELVIMGGSLQPFGGQNLLEVARAGKPVLFGPHMENFAEEAQLLLEHNAALQVESDQQLADTITALLEDSERRTQMGTRGRTALEQRAHIIDDYIEALQRIGVLQ